MSNKIAASPEEKKESLFSPYQIFTLYFPAVVLALGQGIATPVIPVFAKSFGTSFGVASLVIIIHSLGSLLSTLPTGVLVDRWGRRPVLFAGPLLMGAATLMTATARTFTELLLYRFFAGWAQQMWRQSRLALIADRSKDRNRGRQMTGMVAMESSGKLLGPAMGGILAAWSIRLPFVAHGLLSLAAIVPSFYLVRESAPGKNGKSKTNDNAELSMKDFLRTLLNREILSFFSAQIFASMTRGALWSGTLLLYAAYAYNVSPQFLGVLSTATSVIGIPITLSAGYLMDRYGRKTSIVPGFTLTAVGLLILALSSHWRWGLTAFIAIFVWVQSSQSMTSGNMQVLGADIAPAAARGRFFGFWRLAGEIGHIVSPAVFAVLADYVAYSASFSFLSICAFLAAGVIAFRVKETVTARRPQGSRSGSENN